MLDKVLKFVYSVLSALVWMRLMTFIATAGLPHSERCVELRNDFDGKACLLF